jgi:hypothetical protein
MRKPRASVFAKTAGGRFCRLGYEVLRKKPLILMGLFRHLPEMRVNQWRVRLSERLHKAFKMILEAGARQDAQEPGTQPEESLKY